MEGQGPEKARAAPESDSRLWDERCIGARSSPMGSLTGATLYSSHLSWT